MRGLIDEILEWLMAVLIIFGYPIMSWVLYWMSPWLETID